MIPKGQRLCLGDTYLAKNKGVLSFLLANDVLVRRQVHSITKWSNKTKICRREQSEVLTECDILAQEHDGLVREVTKLGVDPRHHV